MCRHYFPQVPTVVVEPGVRTGVPILTDNPKEVGADRVVNALGAFHLYGGPTVVVDFGTATSFDAVSAKGEFLGGAIAPGVEISVDALGARGAQLLKVELARPRSVIGKNTVEALQSGILFGSAGQVDGVVRRMVAEMGEATTVLATGGLAPLLIRECATINAHEPWLTLVGLRLVYARNVDDRNVEARNVEARNVGERITALAPDTATGEHVGVAGRVVLNRLGGKLCFATLRDGSGDLQVMFSLDRLGADALAHWKSDVDLGDHVGVEGEVITSRRGELSVLADRWVLTAKSLRPLPEKFRGLSDPEARG